MDDNNAALNSIKILQNSILLTSLFCAPLHQLHAEIVNPIPSGEWNIPLANAGYDNCEKEFYQYYASGNAADEVGLGFIKKNFPRSDCTWTFKSSLSLDSGKPADFPGSLAQWETVINQSPYVKDILVTAKCHPHVSADETQSITIYPQYICPSGSRYALDSETQVRGCTTLPSTLCFGDVVGRTLDWPLIKDFGHVGVVNYKSITSTPIVQVMSGLTTLIETISFNEFKNAINYWGEKYGLSGLPSYTWDQGISISFAIEDQNKGTGTYEPWPYFIPLEASQISDYNQSTQTWGQQVGSSYPLFRCDTFVDWLYSIGLTQMVIPFHQVGTQDGHKVYRYDTLDLFKTPHSLYNALLNARDNGSDLASIAKSKDNATEEAKSMQYELLIAEGMAYLENPHISRANKIQKYWREYNSSNSKTKQLALGALMLLEPTN